MLILDGSFGILDEQDKIGSSSDPLGQVGKLYIVIAGLPGGQYGTASATTAANNMMRTFSNFCYVDRRDMLHGNYAGAADQRTKAASYEGHVEVVEMLLSNGADVTIHSRHDDIPRRNASGEEFGESLRTVKLIKMLLGNALQAVSYGGRVEVVQMALDAGADSNAQSGHDDSAPHAIPCVE
ncbi:hypothetical protein QQS21_007198 [Conoideocrella luteorostrata]|uniref:Ankyrin n=1 Tax=Conoideocrella luteorostrata TaxID=1105319 RepID=A0AAJ0CLZ3_9HYPO|nr:hypothetical protein QQS21_007198 [Conoideocrella luteorostrata]